MAAGRKADTSMNEAAFFSAARPMFECDECTARYPSPLAAADCSEQDRFEATDRREGRFFRIHRAQE